MNAPFPRETGSDALSRVWDVIIIGAGMGGGIAGRRLAEGGLSVLYVEAGPEGARDDDRPWDGDIIEAEARAERGYWPGRMHGLIDGRVDAFFGALCTGLGGSSAFYAATLERPERHDLEDVAGMAHPTGGWPVGFDAFRPYLAEAERLLDVRGEVDPTEEAPAFVPGEAPPLSEGDAAMYGSFQRVGLRPYRKHIGLRYLPGCGECLGRKCARACKMDGRSAGVEPARATGRAAVLDRCEVRAIRGTRERVTHLEAVRDGRRITLTARSYVLAAGAMGSPRILLGSTSEIWPDGFANRSGLVGKNLMFHLNERIAIWPERRGLDFAGPINTISIRDFYARDGRRFGHLQSMGAPATYGNILHYLRQKLDRAGFGRARLLREAARVPAWVAARIFGDARIFVGILEDLPYETNRVTYDPAAPGRVAFDYRLNPELLERRQAFREMIRRGLGPLRSFYLHADPELNTSHCCGTLRSANDPGRGVVDRDCRAHGIANLHVADASFMPTSTGINPSLTIAANALRVADAILAAAASGAPESGDHVSA